MMQSAKFKFLLLAFSVIISSCSDESNSDAVDVQREEVFHQNDCTSLIPLLDEHGAVFLGEVHGQIQSAETIDCLINHYINKKRQVVVSLEMSESVTARQGNLEETMQKGSSIATPELVCSIHNWSQNELFDVHFHSPIDGRFKENGSFDTTYDEMGRAERIRSLLGDNKIVIVLGGWIHARNTYSTNLDNEIDGYAGYYLRDADIVRVRLVHSQGGLARNCRVDIGCGINEYEPMHLPSGEGNLIASPDRSFDYFYDVGELSPPVINASEACPDYGLTWLSE